MYACHYESAFFIQKSKRLSKPLRKWLNNALKNELLPAPPAAPKGPKTGKMGFFCLFIQQVNEIRVPLEIQHEFKSFRLQVLCYRKLYKLIYILLRIYLKF